MATIKYGMEVISSNVRSVKEILESARIKAFLGFGDNVLAKLNGVIIDEDYGIGENDTITIEQRANTKGATVTIKYGLESIVTDVNKLHEINSNSRIKAYLGFGDNVMFKVHGTIMPCDYTLQEADVVTIEQRSNTKG